MSTCSVCGFQHRGGIKPGEEFITAGIAISAIIGCIRTIGPALHAANLRIMRLEETAGTLPPCTCGNGGPDNCDEKDTCERTRYLKKHMQVDRA